MTQFDLPFVIEDMPWFGYYWKGKEIGEEKVDSGTDNLEEAIHNVNEYLHRPEWNLLTALHVGVVHGIEVALDKKEE